MKSSFSALTCIFPAVFLIGCATIDTQDAGAGVAVKNRLPSTGQPHKDIHLTTRTYDEGSWDIAHEIKSFYLQLLESDMNVKSQYESLIQGSRDENGGLFHVFEPQVIEWIPNEQTWNAPEEFKSAGNYLVIQTTGYGRSRRAGCNAVIVSEFSVIDHGKSIEGGPPKDPGVDRLSTSTRITFLGFRDFQISPINHK